MHAGMVPQLGPAARHPSCILACPKRTRREVRRDCSGTGGFNVKLLMEACAFYCPRTSGENIWNLEWFPSVLLTFRLFRCSHTEEVSLSEGQKNLLN